MSVIRLLNLASAICIAFFISACVTHPAYLPPTGERFSSKPINIERIAIITSMPSEFREKIAAPMTSKLANVFKQSGLNVSSEIQTFNPFALGSDISFNQAILSKPNAYLIIKLAGSSRSTNGYGEWNLVFDLLDEKARGIWRGSVSLRRLNEIENTSDQVAKEVLEKLVNDQVIKIRLHGETT